LRNDGAGEKALIFVNSRKMQDHLLVLFKEKYNLSHVALINGATPEAKRQKAVDDFQESELGFELILLSPKAAGVGFTLTAANHVIHLDRWWNPAVEDQCTDRAYRIGQKKPVTIWIPQAIHPDSDLKDHSFDLRLHDLLEYKRQMSRDLLAPTENREKDTDKLFNEVVSCN
jgi:SNF2 family DNA or RNA helicase